MHIHYSGHIEISLVPIKGPQSDILLNPTSISDISKPFLTLEREIVTTKFKSSKMSYPQTSTLLHVGDWDATTRKHPAMAFMENYTNVWIDSRLFMNTTTNDPLEYHTPSFTFTKPDGTSYSDLESSMTALQALYAPFVAHHHKPTLLCCWEVENGWKMLGVANLSVKLVGSDAGTGKWDVVTPSAFLFTYVKGKGDNQILLQSTQIFSDSGPTVVALMKRGVLKPEDLLAMAD